MIGGAAQEKVTSLSPATAVNFCGALDGAETERVQYVYTYVANRVTTEKQESRRAIYGCIIKNCPF